MGLGITLDRLNPSLLNNTKFAQQDLLLFNRVPKVGSEQLIELLRRLSLANDFGFSRAPYSTPIASRMDETEQEELANTLTDFEEPYTYSMHVNYIDFRQYDLPQPIYINLVRDPVERVISWFYYRRTPWNVVQMYRISKKFRNPQWYKKSFEHCVQQQDPECRYLPNGGFLNQVIDHKRQTLFFCGHDPKCERFNTDDAMQLAKANVEKDYAVVGSWEDVNVTLTVFEHYVPRYFRGAKRLYFDEENGLARDTRNSNPWKPQISEQVKELLRQNFTKEYEFYRFCKQRLYKQYYAIRMNE